MIGFSPGFFIRVPFGRIIRQASDSAVMPYQGDYSVIDPSQIPTTKVGTNNSVA